MELDLEARLMGETLVINISLDPLNEDYIELNDLNKPFDLRRNQDDDLMPTIEEGKVIKEFRTRDEDLDTGIEDYPDKMVYKGDNVVGSLMNVPISVATFSVVTDFAVLEDMDAYRDKGMGDIIIGDITYARDGCSVTYGCTLRTSSPIIRWPPRVTLGRLLPHARGLGFKPRRGGFPSGAKNEWGLSSKAKVRVLHTGQLDVT
nr:hypothetical protein [Tanacetum cinerariifolium]